MTDDATQQPKKITPVRFKTNGTAVLVVILESGQEIEVTVLVTAVGLVEGQKDPLGNQAYFVQTACVPSVALPPEHRRKN
jgi:hypothetical protein